MTFAHEVISHHYVSGAVNTLSENQESVPSERLPSGAVGKRLRASMLFGSVGRIGGVAVGLVLNLLLARILTQEDFADFILNTSIVYFLAPLVSLGSFEVMLSIFSADNRKGVKAISIAVLLTVSGSAVVGLSWAAFCYSTRAALWSGAHWESCLPTTVLVVLLAMSNLVGDVYRGAGRFASGSLLVGYTGGAPQNLAAVMIVAVSAWLGIDQGVSSTLWTLAVSNALGIAGVMFFAPLPLTFAQVWNRTDGAIFPRITSMLGKSLPILGSLILTGTGSQLDIFLAATWLPANEMAAYGAARRLAVLVGYPYMLFNLSIRPVVSQVMKNKSQCERLFGRAGLISTLCAASIALPMSVFAELLFTYLYGPEYSSAAAILVTLCVGSVLQSATGFGGTVLHLSLNGSYTLISQLISLIVYAGFSCAFTRTALGAATGYSALLVFRSLLDGCFCKAATGVFPVMCLPRNHMLRGMKFPFR